MCQSFAARSLCIAGLLALIAATAPIAWSAEEMRTWSDATGKHKVEAKFKEVADGKVTLVRKEGGLMEIALTKLSADDQAYVANSRGRGGGRSVQAEVGRSSAGRR